MTETLVQAARRGVQISFLVPGVSDHPLVRHAGRRQFGRLLEAGIEIHEYSAALLHAKTMVIDGIWATVGSTNLDHRAFKLNDEPNVVAYDADVAGQLEKVFRGPSVREADGPRRLAPAGLPGASVRAAGEFPSKAPSERSRRTGAGPPTMESSGPGSGMPRTPRPLPTPPAPGAGARDGALRRPAPRPTAPPVARWGDGATA